jgi:molybdopterin/thiamine biosynthesis adenylyltransferase
LWEPDWVRLRPYLAAGGVGKIGIVDDGGFKQSERQIIHSTSDVAAQGEFSRSQNAGIKSRCGGQNYYERLTAENALSIVSNTIK